MPKTKYKKPKMIKVRRARQERHDAEIMERNRQIREAAEKTAMANMAKSMGIDMPKT